MHQFPRLNKVTPYKMFKAIINRVDISILIHHNKLMNDSPKEQNAPSSIDEAPQIEINQPIGLDADTHPTESETRKNPRMGIIFACTILFFIIAIFLYRLIYPWKPNANTQPTPDTDNVSNQEESESSSSDNEQQESGSAEHSYQKPQEIVYNDVTIDTLVGTLSCKQSQSNPDNRYCFIPNEKIINAKENYRYILEEFNDETISFNLQSLRDAVNITINPSDQKQVTVTFLDSFNNSWRTYMTPDTPHIFNFATNVTEAKVVGFGQANGHEYLYFVLENGDLWQVKVSDMASEHYEAKIVPDVSGITTVLQGGELGEGDGGNCALAVRSDGLIYHLNPL